MLNSDNLSVRKSYLDSNIIARILRCFFLWIILKWMSTEAHVYMRRHHVKHFDVSNVIYHKFSLGAVSCTLNGENVNVMLEYHVSNISLTIKTFCIKHCIFTQFLVKMMLSFPILKAPAPFPKRGVRVLHAETSNERSQHMFLWRTMQNYL